jgi:hypothetical protein
MIAATNKFSLFAGSLGAFAAAANSPDYVSLLLHISAYALRAAPCAVPIQVRALAVRTACCFLDTCYNVAGSIFSSPIFVNIKGIYGNSNIHIIGITLCPGAQFILPCPISASAKFLPSICIIDIQI